MSALESVPTDCPYCGESIELEVDCSAGNQEYVEDCTVCCRPLSVRVIVDEDGAPEITVRRENE